MKTHLHFIIWAADRVEAGTGNYIDNAIIDLVAVTSEEAEARARGLIKKNIYTIRQIIEHIGERCGGH